MLVLFLFFLNVLFCSLYSLTFRLACSQLARATVCSRTFFAPPFVLLDYVFFVFYLFLFTFGSFYVLCVFVFYSRLFFLLTWDLTFLFRTAFLPLLNTNLLCLHWVLKTFTSSLIVYQLFFVVVAVFFCWSGLLLYHSSFGFFANFVFLFF